MDFLYRNFLLSAFVVFFGFFIVNNQGWAAPQIEAANLQTIKAQIPEQEKELERDKKEYEEFVKFFDEESDTLLARKVEKKEAERFSVQLESSRLKLGVVNNNISAVEQRVVAIKTGIADKEKHYSNLYLLRSLSKEQRKKQALEWQKSIVTDKELIIFYKKLQGVLEDRQDELTELVELKQTLYNKYDDKLNRQERVERERLEIEKEREIKAEYAELQDQYDKLRLQLNRKRLDDTLSEDQETIYEIKLFDLQEQQRILNLKLGLVKVKNDILSIERYLIQKALHQVEAREIRSQIVNINSQLSSLSALISDGEKTLSQKKVWISAKEKNKTLSAIEKQLSEKEFVEVEKDLAAQKTQYEHLEEVFTAAQEKFKKRNAESQFAREPYRTNWQIIKDTLQETINIPIVIGKDIFFSFKQMYLFPQWWKIFSLIGLISLWEFLLALFIKQSKFFLEALAVKRELISYDKFKKMLANLVIKQSWFFGIIIPIGFVVIANDLTGTNTKIYLSLSAIIATFVFIIEATRFFIYDLGIKIDTDKNKLFGLFKYSLIFGMVVSCFIVGSHQLLVSTNTLVFLDRLFMVFLLMFSYVFTYWWNIVYKSLKEIEINRFVLKALKYIGIILPLTLALNALIGLVGYINLSWRIFKIQMYLVFFAIFWSTTRAIIKKATRKIVSNFRDNYKNGKLWAESFVIPTSKLLQILIIFSGFVFLVYFLNIGGRSELLGLYQQILDYNLLSIQGVSLTPLKIIKFIFMFLVITWAAKWSRKFANLVLEKRTNDTGLQNSFAVFIQYITIAVGALLILRILEVDITTITVAVGALAVGLGFGLQELFLDFISGFVILLQRNIRKGDFIEVMEAEDHGVPAEGVVTNIGLLTTTIKNWDKIDVMIPNSQILKSFINNWTFEDNVVSDVFPLKVKFADDPKKILKAVQIAFDNYPDILQEPKPEIWLEGFAENSVIDFKARYYFDLEKWHSSKAKMRSGLMSAIWDELNKEGVELA